VKTGQPLTIRLTHDLSEWAVARFNRSKAAGARLYMETDASVGTSILRLEGSYSLLCFVVEAGEKGGQHS